MIEYQVDEQMLEEVQAKLGAMKAKAPTVISRALNKTATTARVDLANKAQATYTVKSGGFKKDMTIKKASAGRLEAVIHSEGRPLDIDRFHITAPRKSGAKANIIKGGGLKLPFPRRFLYCLTISKFLKFLAHSLQRQHQSL